MSVNQPLRPLDPLFDAPIRRGAIDVGNTPQTFPWPMRSPAPSTFVQQTGGVPTFVPTTTPSPGSLLISCVAVDTPGASNIDDVGTGGWTVIGAQQYPGSVFKTILAARIWYSGGQFPPFTTDPSEQFMYHRQAWVDHGVVDVANDIHVAVATASSGLADPPFLDPGPGDFAVVAFASVYTNNHPSAGPPGYTQFTVYPPTNNATWVMRMASANTEVSNSPADPGAFTHASAPWAAWTIAFPRQTL